MVGAGQGDEAAMTNAELELRVRRLEVELLEARSASYYSLLCVSLALHALRAKDDAAFIKEIQDLGRGVDRLMVTDEELARVDPR